jgi:hypothetical protein
MFIEANNWFFSALVQANAALIAIVSAFVINKALNEYENIHALDTEFNDVFYKVRSLINGLPQVQTCHIVKKITIEQAKQIGSSRSNLANWQNDSIENYNALVRLYLKETNKRERISILRKWMHYVYLLILVLVIIPACFIFPEGVKGIQIICNLKVILSTLLSLKSIVLVVTYIMILIGLSFIKKALNKVIEANASRVQSIRNVFDEFSNVQQINSVLTSIIDEK